MRFLFRGRPLHAALGAFALFAGSHAAWAAEPFTIRDLRVEGLQRVEPGTIFHALPLHVGDTYTDDLGSAAIRALYELGMFKDVRLDISGNVLVVIVEERPTIAGVDFEGAKEFDKQAMTKALREVGLAEGRPYDKALADRAEQELKRQYIGKGYYSASVQTTATPLENNRVNISFTVTEGESARITEVRVVGAKAFSEKTLLGLFDLDAGNWMSWYTKSNQYSRAKLDADLETLRQYYLTRGYMDFRIDSTQVGLSADRQSVTVTVNITEGERFVVAGVRLEGDYLGREDDFKSLVTVRPGDYYNGDDVTATTRAFTEHYARFGFAFAKVEAVPDADRTTGRVTMVFKGLPRQRVFVRRILVGGNARTRDEVIRREMRQYESAWYEGDKIKLSRDRLDRLGYFSDVDIQTQEVPGSPDTVDLMVDVKEKPTGSLNLGAGYSSTDKVTLTFGITQENVFGSGNYLGLNASIGSYSTSVSVSAIDPYFTADGISRIISVYQNTTRPSYAADGNYKLTTQGVSLKFGVPFDELNRVYFGLGLERYSFKPGTNGAYTLVDGSYVYTATPQAYLDYFECSGTAPSVVCARDAITGVPLTIGWSRDTRDSALVPTRGTLQNANAEWGLASGARYLKTSYQYQRYFPISKQYTFALNGELGWARALGGDTYPVFKNFYAGGLGSVRGFESNSLGPRDSVTAGALGGLRKAIVNAELSTPFPGAGNDRTLRLFGFFDAGNVFADRTSSLTDAQWKAQQKLRASVGLGVSWLSPLGPLSLAYAVPVLYQKEDTAAGITADRTQRFQFQIGTSF
ncbi:outer membrane protein assembly factor BamA [Pseudacidovorax intermedius]|uniref:outer membrane protein assembly factor BamA n=1 Tax=Pseudacidovorax intermedius TaxID=433924 RepID=UPI0025CBEFF2|nr:outer membrane protein assembly factor BamA [Pseudacidovorax intermedius]